MTKRMSDTRLIIHVKFVTVIAPWSCQIMLFTTALTDITHCAYCAGECHM